jgi:flagellar motor switch protein FliM
MIRADEDANTGQESMGSPPVVPETEIKAGGSPQAVGSKTSVRVYDFRRPARISKDRKRSLEAIYGVLAKALEGWLRGRVRDPITLDLQSVEELTFGEFLTALPSPCASFIVDEKGPAGHQGIVDFGQELAFFLVDRLLGGTAQPALFERSLTPTERLLVRIAAERVTWQLSDSWKDYVEMDLRISGFESIPEMLLIANREDPVLVATLTVSTGDMSSPLTLCLPIAALEKFFISTGSRKAPVAKGNPEEREEERKYVEGTLRSARIPVQARFNNISLTLKELAALKPGSVLQTGLSTDAELAILVAGQKRFVGSPGKLGGKLAALVGDSVDKKSNDIFQPS